MGFIAKGARKLVTPGTSGTAGSYLFKRMNSDGTFSDAVWGTSGNDFNSPVVSSTWSTYGAYQYISLGLVRQIYSENHTFDRNVRFDSWVRLSNTISPVDANISDVAYVTAVVRGTLTEDVATISQRVIDEFSAGEYNNVVAIGVMNRAIDDYRPINIDVNDIKTFEGSAETTKDYTLSTEEAIYLINIALVTNATMEGITSLSMNVYQQSFTEFLGDSYVAPGSVGKTEMNPDYKAENAINNYIMVFDDSNIVDGTLVISPDYTTSINDNSVYYANFKTSNEPTINKVSLGVFDIESDTYVSSGAQYDCIVTGSIKDKVCVVIVTGNTINVKSLL